MCFRDLWLAISFLYTLFIWDTAVFLPEISSVWRGWGRTRIAALCWSACDGCGAPDCECVCSRAHARTWCLFFKIGLRERERETSVCCSTCLCTHRLLLVRALTRDLTLHLGTSGRCSASGATQAGPRFAYFLMKVAGPDALLES